MINDAPNDAYVIETRADIAAGIAVREADGFRFFASTGPFYRLENRRFRHLRAVQAAVDETASQRASTLSWTA